MCKKEKTLPSPVCVKSLVFQNQGVFRFSRDYFPGPHVDPFCSYEGFVFWVKREFPFRVQTFIVSLFFFLLIFCPQPLQLGLLFVPSPRLCDCRLNWYTVSESCLPPDCVSIWGNFTILLFKDVVLLNLWTLYRQVCCRLKSQLLHEELLLDLWTF